MDPEQQDERIMRTSRYFISENRIMNAMSLYPGKSRQDVISILENGLKKRMLLMSILAVVTFILFVLLGKMREENEAGSNVIQRSNVNGNVRNVSVRIGNDTGWSDGTIEVKPYEMTDEEIDEMQAQICQILDERVINSNSSYDDVKTNLLFPAELDGYPVLIDWSSDRPDVLNGYGEVKNEDIESGINVLIRGKINYGDEFRIYERLITVCPPERDENGRIIRSGFNEIKTLEEAGRNEREFVVPESVGGLNVEVLENKSVSMIEIGAFISVIIMVYAYSSYFSTLTTKRKERLMKAEYAYKDFVSKLSLLLSAGMTLRTAWRKLAIDYASGDMKEGLLSQNLSVAERELENGELEQEVYERFGERMENIAYQRLAQILNQQVSKGVTNLTATLTAELKEVVAKEKENIRVRGEEAGTKLLIPMVGILVIVFAILLVPAFISF